jgi:Tol biopolymer transport system component
VKEAISQAVDELESKHRAFSYRHGRWKVAVVVASAVLAAGVMALRTLPFGDSDVVQTPAPISPIEASLPVHRQLTFIGNVTEAGLSPDGRTFAYTTGGRLLIQDVGGGPSIEIARGKILRPRWSPRGDRLAFHPFNEGGIRIVSRLGGPIRQVTSESYSAWSPDGLRMAVAYPNPLGFRIIDVKDGRVLGSVVLPGLGFVEGIEWHPRLDRLALLERVGGDFWVIWTVTPDGSEGRPIHAESQAISSMCWSPVENILYFLRSQNEAAELMAIDLDRTDSRSPRLLMSGLPNGGSLTISADGRFLVHIRASGNSNLARLNLKGPNRTLEFITKGTQRFDLPSVAPDGQWIAARIGIEPRTRLVKIPIAGGEPIPLTSGDNFDGAPAWSPDGTRIAFASSSAGTTAVWLIRSDGTQLKRVDNSTPSVNLMTSWTPDGRLMWQEMTHGQVNYRIRDLSSGDDSLLLSGDNDGAVFAPEFSPNGKEVAVFGKLRGGPRGIYVLSWPARVPRFITNSIVGANAVGWSANGASIIAMSGGVWFVSTRNGQARRIAGVSDVVTGDVTPDGESAIVSVKNWTADAWLIENFDQQAKVVRWPYMPPLASSHRR